MPVSSGPRHGAPVVPGGSGRGAAQANGELEALVVSHWLDTEPEGEPYTATIRLSGRRLDVGGKAGGHDSFVKEENVPGIVPGSGRVSVTTLVQELHAGEWSVTADLVRRTTGAGTRQPVSTRSSGTHTLPRAAWSWRRWTLSTAPFAPVKTRMEPFVRLTRVPAVIHGSWSGLIAVGVVVGAIVHALLLGRQGIGVSAVLLVDLVAAVAGLLGAKLWYLVQRPRAAGRESIGEGWTVDGFVLAVPAVAAALLLLDLPVGAFFDAGTPALFFGIAIGRLGCFLTGCCAGRCTRSRWGIWSSDRRVGARRIPTQLLESATGLLIGIATLMLVLGGGIGVGGAIFVGGFAAYILVRQFLLRLRTQPHDAVRARVTAVVAAVVLLADAIVVLMNPR
ncbi:MAG: prolipoprotein diacylglyceryl transferase [Chloroflexi bacterium]|nr:prolipoprotein diacylglyceryl transferase [Chloroflexota bacterium]